MNVRSENQFLQAVARRLVRDRAQADDLVQEAWLVVLRRGVDDIEKPRPWLAGVLRNLAFRAGRSQRRRSHYEENAPPADAGNGSAPDDRAALEEAKRSVLLALESLEPSYREVVYLRYFDNLNSTQIAARLSLSPSAVRTRLQRALRAMRTKLEASWSGDARALSVGLAAMAAGWLPRAPSSEIGRRWLTGSASARLGAAAAVLIAAVAWWAALSNHGTPTTPPITIASAATASPSAPIITPVAPRTAPAKVTAESSRRLLAAIVVEDRGGLDGPVRVTFRSEPAGLEMEREVRFDRTSVVDLSEMTERAWPAAVWVEAQQGSHREYKRFEVPLKARSDVVLSVSLALGEPDRSDSPALPPPPPAPAADAPSTSAPAPVVLRRDEQASSPVLRRSGRAQTATASATASAPAAAPVGIPTLRRRVVQDTSNPPVAETPPVSDPLPGIDPRKRYPGDTIHGAYVPDPPPPGTVEELPLPLPGGGSVVIQIETHVDDKSYWLGDDNGPFFELPPEWRRGDAVAVDGLAPGRYRVFSLGRRGWRPRSHVDVFAYERSAIVLRDRDTRDHHASLGPMPNTPYPLPGPVGFDPMSMFGPSGVMDSSGAWSLSMLAQRAR